ncbi:MAG: carboxypeptidase-like regulatory domain-containing protein [Planctomycetota bacterium]
MMYKTFRSFLTVLLAGMLAIGPVTAQELSDTLADEIASLEGLGETLETVNPTAQVHLDQEGSFSGRFRLVWPTGKTEPADAEVRFTAHGNTIESTQTNEDTGHYLVQGLSPGDYVVTASITEGSTDFNVEVLPFDQDAQPEEMFMDATLTPMPEYVEGEILVEDPLCCGEELCGCEMYQPACCGFSDSCCGSGYGGGGGGGSPLGWLLGAAGLAAGIGALADNNNNNNQPVSPVNP